MRALTHTHTCRHVNCSQVGVWQGLVPSLAVQKGFLLDVSCKVYSKNATSQTEKITFSKLWVGGIVPVRKTWPVTVTPNQIVRKSIKINQYAYLNISIMKACWNSGNTNPHLPLIGRFWNGIDASSTAELTETKPSVWNHWEIMGKARNLSWDTEKDMLRIASLSTNLKHQSILIVGRTFGGKTHPWRLQGSNYQRPCLLLNWNESMIGSPIESQKIMKLKYLKYLRDPQLQLDWTTVLCFHCFPFIPCTLGTSALNQRSLGARSVDVMFQGVSEHIPSGLGP